MDINPGIVGKDADAAPTGFEGCEYGFDYHFVADVRFKRHCAI